VTSRLGQLLLAGMLLLSAAEPADAQTKTRLKIFSATDTSAIQAIIDAFEARYPSIEIDYSEYNTSELHEIIESKPLDVDVVISSAMDLQTDLINKGFGQPFRPQNFDDLPAWSNWLGTLYGFTYEPVAMIYNKAAFAKRPLPSTRSELAAMIRDDSAFFDGKIGLYDISLSGVGYMFATQDALRDGQFSRVLESFGRAGAQTYCCTSEIVGRVTSGDLVFGYNVIGSYALAAAQKEPRLGITLFSDYALVMTRSAFVMHNAPHPNEAGLLISFLLSKEGQSIIASSSSLLPLQGEGHTPASGALLKSSRALLPIRLGPGLLTYLDDMKRARFLSDWQSSMIDATNNN
jgi:iron(III) transport system substrate-binding protein